MKKAQEALHSYIQGHFPEADEQLLRALDAVVLLEKGEPDASLERRRITITQDGAGPTRARSIKWYNAMQVSVDDLKGFLLGKLAVHLAENTRLMLVLTVLMLLYEFNSKLCHAFDERDARLLLVIFELGSDTFAPSDVLTAHSRRFGESIPEEQVAAAFESFRKLKVLHYDGSGKYVLRENITCKRKEEVRQNQA